MMSPSRGVKFDIRVSTNCSKRSASLDAYSFEKEASRAADAPYGEIGASVVSPDTEIKALRCCMS